jgi:hypothetical protein
MLAAAGPAAAQTGGSTAPGAGTTSSSGTTSPAYPTVPGNRAKLTKKGRAIPPANAPANVQAAINAANQIRKRPYRYGGGHRSFYDTGYDCSGAVSFVLHHAGLLSSPMPSGPMASSWGVPGKGQWITVYANAGHAYAVVAGLRWDTSAMGSGSGKGPRWRGTKRSPRGYVAKHAEGF